MVIAFESIVSSLQVKGYFKSTFKYSPRDKILSNDLYKDF